MQAAEQPADGQRDGDGGVGLVLDHLARGGLERVRGLAHGGAGGVGDMRGLPPGLVHGAAETLLLTGTGLIGTGHWQTTPRRTWINVRRRTKFRRPAMRN